LKSIIDIFVESRKILLFFLNHEEYEGWEAENIINFISFFVAFVIKF